MIEATVDAKEGTAKLRLDSDIPELFAECCMFIAAVVNRMGTTAEPLKEIFARALSEYCKDIADGTAEEGIINVVSIDRTALDKIKEIADKQKEE